LGLVSLPAPDISVVYENIAKAIIEYKAIGITQYLFMGWPDIEEMTHFAKGVLPCLGSQ
jgi:alkanesulfonate monooxygenase